ncbi:MAG: glycerophosphodiester phosphodiesterase [Cobetia sp.]|jgi:glycerophosphoryl diester phosphodiesterase|uniref:glycerophosphodiester phosphodiesterase n=1 Tax=Cobetia sp. TaxID=1873876 RepID=UPI002580F55A|nr:glycerophosphodiester phosphodiesterase [Cobetia sp.]|tara:strand:+ start:54681 stop:55841 length:1161 start_codon:yes stop_codon:yes gene_type:complete
MPHPSQRHPTSARIRRPLAMMGVVGSLLATSTSVALADDRPLRSIDPGHGTDKVVVAHRGASGYLPEHTLAAKAMAYAQGADFLEQDVVMSKDDQLVVLHDRFLDRVTNVAEVFPERARDDGRYYAIDFTLDELRKLAFSEGFTVKDGEQVADYPERFPLGKSHFGLHTLSEEIEMIQGLNHSTGRDVGLYVEIKAPWFHQSEGKQVSRAVLETLKHYGYVAQDDNAVVQVFDPNGLKRIHDTLQPELEMNLRLVQLMGETRWDMTFQPDAEGKLEPYDYDWMYQEGGMQRIATYADGIGPWKPMVIEDSSTRDDIKVTPMVEEAHAQGLIVMPYTFRLDEGRIPDWASDYDDMLRAFFVDARVDGVFTDYPDRAVQWLKQHGDAL